MRGSLLRLKQLLLSFLNHVQVVRLAKLLILFQVEEQDGFFLRLAMVVLEDALACLRVEFCMLDLEDDLFFECWFFELVVASLEYS